MYANDYTFFYEYASEYYSARAMETGFIHYITVTSGGQGVEFGPLTVTPVVYVFLRLTSQPMSTIRCLSSRANFQVGYHSIQFPDPPAEFLLLGKLTNSGYSFGFSPFSACL